jgi:hypothetical protein
MHGVGSAAVQRTADANITKSRVHRLWEWLLRPACLWEWLLPVGGSGCCGRLAGFSTVNVLRLH